MPYTFKIRDMARVATPGQAGPQERRGWSFANAVHCIIYALMTALWLFFFVFAVVCRKKFSEGVVYLRNRELNVEEATRATRRRRSLFPSHGLFLVRTKNMQHGLEEHFPEMGDFLVKKNTYLVHVGERHTQDEETMKKLRESLVFADEFGGEDKTVMNFRGLEKGARKDLMVLWYGVLGDEDVEEVERIDGIKVMKKMERRLEIQIAHNHHKALESLRALSKVIAIFPKLKMVPKNYYGNKLLQGIADGKEYTLHKYGIKGQGQLIAIADTGLDLTNCLFYDPKVPNPEPEKVYTNHRKLYYYTVVPGASFGEDEDGGHGTHVSGSAAGKCESTAPNFETVSKFNGAAPEAKIFFIDTGDMHGDLHNPPDLLSVGFLKTPYDHGVRVHSNSWGCGVSFDCIPMHWPYQVFTCICKFSRLKTKYPYNGELYDNGDLVPAGFCRDVYNIPDDKCCKMCSSYTPHSYEMDLFSYQNDEMLVFVAGGNSGAKGSFSTIEEPATGLNIVAVGNSQTTWDGFIDATKWWKNKLTLVTTECAVSVNSFADCCALTSVGPKCALSSVKKLCCPSYALENEFRSSSFSNENNMAKSSSRGPTWDNRVAPLVVATGDHITSANSMPVTEEEFHCGPDTYTTLTDEEITKRGLVSMVGTSMSTPLLAGTTLLVRQYFTDGFYPNGVAGGEAMPKVSGNLVRSVLVHSAKKLNGTVELGEGSVVNLTDLLSFQAAARLPYPDDFKGPDFAQGHGYPKVGETLKTPDSHAGYFFRVLDRVAIKEEETHHYSLTKTSNPSETEVKVTMGFYDEPSHGIQGYINPTRNDVDLKVVVGDTTYWGNFQTGGDMNNVEKVSFSANVGDVIEIYVSGFEIVSDIKYALVVSGTGLECTTGIVAGLCMESSPNPNSGGASSNQQTTESSTSLSDEGIAGIVLGSVGTVVVAPLLACTILTCFLGMLVVCCFWCFILIGALMIGICFLCAGICSVGSVVWSLVSCFCEGGDGKYKKMKGGEVLIEELTSDKQHIQ